MKSTLFVKFFSLIFLLLNMSLLASVAQRHVTVIVPSFNNKDYYQHNLDSVFSQTYDNFHVIYINDCSTDGTGELVERYLDENNVRHRVHLMHNKCNRGAMANLYRAIHMCHDTDLVVILDGDDAFLHENVLASIERIHREHNCWVSYAQFLNLPENKAVEAGLSVMGYAAPTPIEVIKNKSYRQHPWSWSGLRSFDAWLFKQIRLEDLLDRRPGHEGEFFSVCYDNACFSPCLKWPVKKWSLLPIRCYIAMLIRRSMILK